MPSPWLMARASGFYCRVFVPADLRPHVGQRFLVRALHARDRDEARLIAARWAIDLAALYRRLRRELTLPEPKLSDVLKAIQSGGTRDFGVKNTFGPGGVLLSTEVLIESEADAALAKKHLPHLFAAPPPASAVAAEPAKYRSKPDHGIPVSQRIELYDAALTRDNRTKKYKDESKAAIGILIGIAGDHPPDDYEPSDIDFFVERLEFLPLNADKDKKYRERWATRTHLERSHEVELLDLPRIDETTANKHIARLSAFFSFCMRRNYMAGRNPMEGRVSKPSITKGNSAQVLAKRQAFTQEQLAAIFDPVRYRSRNRPHAFWPPLLAMMTGARVNEIAQLYLDDIVDDDPSNPGRWRIMILAKRPDQRVKNPSSIRSIPIHPKLIELGFLTYLADVRRLGYERVFPTLRYTDSAGYGDGVTDLFMPYLRKKVGITDSNLVGHSFRYVFCNQMFNLTTNPEVKAERMHVVSMTGHEREGTFENTYAGELYYVNKMDLLMRLQMPALAIPPYKAGDFDKFFKSDKANKQAAVRRKAQKDKEAAQVAPARKDSSAGSA